MKSSAPLDGAVLWDPSHGLAWRGGNAQWKRENLERVVEGMVIGVAGKGGVHSKVMDAQDKELGDTSSWAAHKRYPLKVITAGRGPLGELGEKYIEVADEPKEFIKIEAATHNFRDSDEIMLRLLEETASWFKEILDGKY